MASPRAAADRAYLVAVPALPGRSDPGLRLFSVDLLDGTRAHVLAVAEHATRRIRILGVTQHPTGARTAQQARNLLRDFAGQAHRAKFMIRERGSNFSAAFHAVLADGGIRTVLWNQAHLRQILRQYETHHNQHRPHRSLHAAAPMKPLPEPVGLDQYRVRKTGSRRWPDQTNIAWSHDVDEVSGTHRTGWRRRLAVRPGPGR